MAKPSARHPRSPAARLIRRLRRPRRPDYLALVHEGVHFIQQGERLLSFLDDEGQLPNYAEKHHAFDAGAVVVLERLAKLLDLEIAARRASAHPNRRSKRKAAKRPRTASG